MSPYAAAGMLEIAHRLGLMPFVSDSTRNAIMAGLVGYGLGQPSDESVNELALARERAKAERFAYFRELEARVLADRAARQREYDEHLRAVLANAALAHNTR